MSTEKALKRNAVEVEELLTTNPKAKKIFQKQIGIWCEHRLIYRKKRKEADDAGVECKALDPVGIEYWACENDKRPIYYSYVATAYDWVKGNAAPYELCRDILDDEDWATLIVDVSGSSDDSFLDTALRWIKCDLASTKPQKDERNMIMIDEKSSKEIWEAIKSEYGYSRPEFGKKINFIKDPFKRKVIFRDIEHAFVLASQGFSKPAIILAGGVIEELLRLYLEHRNVKATTDRFADYVKACEDNGLLKRGVLRLTDSVRDFRNLVHLAKETEKRHTISKATAKGAVSSIFTIANDFQ